MISQQDIENGLGELDEANRHLKSLGHEMIMADPDNHLWKMDLFIFSVLHRAMCLNSGFSTMIEKQNFICAAPMVRLQLDNLLRLSAAWLVEKPHEFADDFLEGIQIPRMKDREGKLMRDKYLVDKIKEEYPWAERIYKETSGYVHLSDKHLHNAIIGINGNILEMGAYPHDIAIPDSSRLEAIKVMLEINVAIYQYIYGWKESKVSRPEMKVNSE